MNLKAKSQDGDAVAEGRPPTSVLTKAAPGVAWEFEKDAPTVRREILRKLLPRLRQERICRAGGEDGGLPSAAGNEPWTAAQAGAAPVSTDLSGPELI